MSSVSSVGGLLNAMKWLKPDVSHANDIVRDMTDSDVAVKWVLQHLRSTNVTYNGYTGEIRKSVLLEKLRWYLASLGLQKSGGSSPSEGLCSNSCAPNDYSKLENPSEAARLRRIYETVDENGDDRVTIEEIGSFLNKLGMQMSYEDVESVVCPLSSSEDGSLRFEQFVILYESLCKDIVLSTDSEEGDEPPNDLIEAFKVFDKNRDGYISSEELQQILDNLGFGEGRDLSNCEKMICKFDLDSNGLLDFYEFKKMMKRKD